tara:strand:+ start:254 stop:418 length:165 start_codon:yes stop_codon:yes gene_type:complete
MNWTLAALAVGIAVGLLLAGNTDTIDIIVNPMPIHNNNRRVVKYVFFFCVCSWR